MKALRRWLIGTSVFAFLAVGTGCSSQAEDDSEETEGALGEDSGKIVQTSQTDLLLYQGYNSVFDKGRGGCVRCFVAHSHGVLASKGSTPVSIS